MLEGRRGSKHNIDGHTDRHGCRTQSSGGHDPEIEAAGPTGMPAVELSAFYAIPIRRPLPAGVPLQASRSYPRCFLWRRESRYGNCRTMFLAFGVLFRISSNRVAVRSW